MRRRQSAAEQRPCRREGRCLRSAANKTTNHAEIHMRTCHVAGFAVVGASALASAMALAGPPPIFYQSSPTLHYQLRYFIESVEFNGCESRPDGYFCRQVGAGNYTNGLVVSVNETEQTGSVIAQRYLWCELSPGSLDVSAAGRAVRLEALIDIAADTCSTSGFFYDFNTGEGGVSEFPNSSMSIRAHLSDPWAALSTKNTGHYSTADRVRESVSCNNDTQELFQDTSVEIDGSSMMVDYSRANTSRCNTVGK